MNIPMTRGICPFAIQRPLNRNSRAITPTVLILHSNAGSGSDLFDWWNNPQAGGVYSHFQIDLEGRIYQYENIFRRAPANYDANNFSVSVETANNYGYSKLPEFNQDVWQGKQRSSVIRLGRWIVAETVIPAKRCTDARYGIAGHNWYRAWTHGPYACPGESRSTQLVKDIIPAIAAKSEPTEPPKKDSDMYYLHFKNGTVLVTNFITFRRLTTRAQKDLARFIIAASSGTDHVHENMDSTWLASMDNFGVELRT